MKSFEEIKHQFSASFNDLNTKRKRSIILTAFGWGLFMLFILAITGFILMSFINRESFSSGWMNVINSLMDSLPKGFPPQIVIIGGFVIISYGLSFLLKKSFNAESNFKFKTKKLLKKVALTTLPSFDFNRKIRVKKDEVKQSSLFNYLKNGNHNNIVIADTLSHQYQHTLLKVCDLEVYGSSIKQSTSFLMRLPFLNQLILSIKLIKSLTKKQNMTDTLKNESFKGVFAIADFNKTLQGHTIVLPDRLEKTLGGFAHTIQKFNFKKEELVKLENPEFEKEFVVYSTNQVEARYALTPSMMEKLTLLKKKINKPIMVSFKSDKVNVAISNTNGFFGVDKSVTMDDELLEHFYNQLVALSSIVEELNINNNLWNKL